MIGRRWVESSATKSKQQEQKPWMLTAANTRQQNTTASCTRALLVITRGQAAPLSNILSIMAYNVYVISMESHLGVIHIRECFSTTPLLLHSAPLGLPFSFSLTLNSPQTPMLLLPLLIPCFSSFVFDSVVALYDYPIPAIWLFIETSHVLKGDW